MNFQHLQEHYFILISYLKDNNYTSSYVSRFKKEILWILHNATIKQWTSYVDVYQEYTKTPHTERFLAGKRCIIGAIQQFDLHHLFPDGRRMNSLFPRGIYPKLLPEFQQFIDYYKRGALQSKKKADTIQAEIRHTICFLYDMQKKGCNSLDQISQACAQSFFISDDGEPVRCSAYQKQISSVIKACTAFNENACKRLLLNIPKIREKRNNIQYLTTQERILICNAIYNLENQLSYRDRAIGMLLLYTGMRGCDIAGLEFSSIDWEKEKLCITQQKTDVYLELPLLPVVGNSIYDYVTMERPNTEEPRIFLCEKRPFTPLHAASLRKVVKKILYIAGVRNLQGDRKGTHIFRHNLTAILLENHVSQPVISKVLGHTTAESLTPYLNADLKHLKECALDIDPFPVDGEVFES